MKFGFNAVAHSSQSEYCEIWMTDMLECSPDISIGDTHVYPVGHAISGETTASVYPMLRF